MLVPAFSRLLVTMVSSIQWWKSSKPIFLTQVFPQWRQPRRTIAWLQPQLVLLIRWPQQPNKQVSPSRLHRPFEPSLVSSTSGTATKQDHATVVTLLPNQVNPIMAVVRLWTWTRTVALNLVLDPRVEVVQFINGCTTMVTTTDSHVPFNQNRGIGNMLVPVLLAHGSRRFYWHEKLSQYEKAF